MDNSLHQRVIGKIISKGFEKASAAFSKLINRRVSFDLNSVSLIRHVSDPSLRAHNEQEAVVLTTDIIGELSGRSYLILDQREMKVVCDAVNPKLSEHIREALLLEIDNIISASVISEIANALGIEIYGDVPALQFAQGNAITALLDHSIPQQETTGFILCWASFKIENQETIHPQFIWKLGTRICELIERTYQKSGHV